jgi:hypothetical protein
MLFLRGTRTARIKVYEIHDIPCHNCKDFDLTLVISREYFHIWFVPIAPSGVKTTKIYCHGCSQFMRSDSLTREYESKTRTPFYLYTGMILGVLAILMLVAALSFSAYSNKVYITQPRMGDVYELKLDSPYTGMYSFLRVMRVDKDSVVLIENTEGYHGTVSSFDAIDYFDTNREETISKADLRDMHDKSVIVDINRDYGDATGFNRIK